MFRIINFCWPYKALEAIIAVKNPNEVLLNQINQSKVSL